LAATSAFAQVTISGNVDASFGTKEAINGAGKTIAKSTGVQDGLNAPNRIFINVTEDLGGGMKFKFQNEHGISLTNAQDWSVRQSNGAPTSQTLVDKTMTTSDVSIPGNAFLTNGTNRGTFVALEGGFGEVRAGYLVSQFYNLVAQSGYFLGSENYGALVQGHGIAAQGSTRGNGIDYKLPKVGAFTFSVQKRYGEERTITADSADAPYTSNKAETMSYRADYANGPLTAGYVYATHKGVVAAQAKPIGTSVFGVASTTNLVPNDVNNTADNKASALNAAYVMGNWKVAYQMTSATVNNTLDTDRKFKSSQIGIQYTMGNTSVFGISGNADTKKNDGTKTNDIKNTQFGVRHALSKRTTAYVMTGKSEDSAIAANDTTRAKEGKMTGVGLSHAF
jgi:major outer membrane protein P.IB